jgi:hypothetical protein
MGVYHGWGRDEKADKFYLVDFKYSYSLGELVEDVRIILK